MKDNRNSGEDEVLHIEFGSEIDLHHFSPRYTASLVREFLNQSVVKGYREVRIVHGKGRSQKKEEVYLILGESPHVLSYHDYGPNWGVTVVLLKQCRNN